MTNLTSIMNGPPPAVEAVFFDFGGVFIDSPFAAVATVAAKLAVDEATLIGVIFGPYAVDTDHPWHRLERGELAFAAAREEITDLARSSGLGDLDPFTVLAEMAGGGLVIREFVVDAVRHVRSLGIKTGVITNNIAEFGSTWKALLPIDELFDDIVDSSDVGVRKPDGAIYRLACERLGVHPSASWFIDDYQGNVDGAVNEGLRSLCCGYSVASTQAAIEVLLAELDSAGGVS